MPGAKGATMGCRVVLPETTRIELEGGEWIRIKRRLNAGEAWAAYTRTIKGGAIIRGQPIARDPNLLPTAKAAAYLLDWSFTDPAGRPIVIANQPPEVIEAALRSFDSATAFEIQAAIDRHDADEEIAIDEEKKRRSSVTTSEPAWPSVAT
jgi:hypothetical protein